MNEQQIKQIIDHAIRQHERRFAIISGFSGAVILAGIFHAVWSLKQSL